MRLKRHKYGAKRVELDGIRFDSKAEAARYIELKALVWGNRIRDLQVHPFWRIMVGGVQVCLVILDFSYLDVDTGRMVYEDVKGKDTDLSRLKRKLLEAQYGITVKLITSQRRTRRWTKAPRSSLSR